MISKTPTETKNIAKKFASTLRRGDVVLLYGELGAGKTAFTKGLAEYFGIEKNITSPTFTLMNVYPLPLNPPLIKRGTTIGANQISPSLQEGATGGVNTLVHIDTYRLKNAQELIDIGVEDYLGASDAICVIEWPEKIQELLKDKKTIAVTIEHVGENSRNIVIL